jgi:tetratricopeptide (TPR) repeat protein
LDAAVAACEGRDEFEVLDLLTHLADKSLLVVERLDGGEPRYRFLETVRQYGRDLLIESGEGDAARRRHRDWFLELAERAAPHLTGPDQAAWLDRLEAENDNLRAALDWCIEEDADAESGVRLSGALQWFWAIRGHFTEGRQWFAAALAKQRSTGPTPGFAMALHGAGNMAFRQDDYAAARVYYERALAVREQLGDRRGVAGSLGSLGNVAQYQGRYAEARSLFERSLAINREVGYRVWEAANLTCLGNVSRHLGDFEASRSFLEQAVSLNREIGNRVGESSSLSGLADLLLQRGEPAAAKPLYEQALAIEREIGNVHDQGVSLASLAGVAQKQGDASRARSLCAESLVLLRRVGARIQIASGLERLASLAALAGRPDRAVRLWAAAHALRQTIEAPMNPFDRDALDGEVAAVRSSLDPASFQSAWRQGSEMTLDQAIEYGLEAPAAVNETVD